MMPPSLENNVNLSIVWCDSRERSYVSMPVDGLTEGSSSLVILLEKPIRR